MLWMIFRFRLFIHSAEYLSGYCSNYIDFHLTKIKKWRCVPLPLALIYVVPASIAVCPICRKDLQIMFWEASPPQWLGRYVLVLLLPTAQAGPYNTES